MARIYRGTIQEKGLNDPDNHNGVLAHLEPDILQCEVKRTLGSITASKVSGGNGTPAELLKILKDDAVKVLYSICQKIWKIQQQPRDWKRSHSVPIAKQGIARECSNYHTIVLIWHASKLMLKIIQARLQQYMNRELPDVQAGFRKGRGTRGQIASFSWIIEKVRESQKNNYFCFIDYSKTFHSVDHNKLWKFWKRWEYEFILPAPSETYMQVKKKQVMELDMEQWTSSKLGKEYVKSVCCHPAYLTYIQSTSCDMLDWMNHKLESRLLGKITTTLGMQIIPL